ncbi:MAG: hypothetical protein H7Z37_04510 [Pyrinomonadaceae bacterium]|nr:hypothetical protein [Pyrinomonadaceae bacterium]
MGIIEPDAVCNGKFSAILQKVNHKGFTIRRLKLKNLPSREAESFYAVRKERGAFGKLCKAVFSF